MEHDNLTLLQTSNGCEDTSMEMTLPLRQAKVPSQLLSMEDWDAQAPQKTLDQVPRLMPGEQQMLNPEAVTEFHQLCVKHRLTPLFTFEQQSFEAFSGSVVVGSSLSITVPGLFPSKRVAKHRLCEHALPRLVQWLQNTTAIVQPGICLEIEENWLESSHHCLAMDKSNARRAQVVYSDSCFVIDDPQWTSHDSRSAMHAATVRVSTMPGKEFGNPQRLFTSKTLARQGAAKEAVLFLRSLTGGAVATVDHAMMYNQEAIPQHVKTVAESMGLRAPSWIESAVPHEHGHYGWYYAAARFSNLDREKDERLQGDVGKVGPIYGKKNAKLEACKKVLSILEQIRAEYQHCE